MVRHIAADYAANYRYDTDKKQHGFSLFLLTLQAAFRRTFFLYRGVAAFVPSALTIAGKVEESVKPGAVFAPQIL